MSKAFVKPSEWESAAEAQLVKGRGGFKPRKRAITREEHRAAVVGDDYTTLGEARAFQAVVEELARTVDRVLPADPLRRVALVVEEAGEALKEAIDETRVYETPAMQETNRSIARWRCRNELIQCASMAIRVLGAMDEEDRVPAKKKNRPLIGPYRRRAVKP